MNFSLRLPYKKWYLFSGSAGLFIGWGGGRLAGALSLGGGGLKHAIENRTNFYLLRGQVDLGGCLSLPSLPTLMPFLKTFILVGSNRVQ